MTRTVKPILLSYEAEFVAEIDQARGDVPRTVWIRRACERALSRRALDQFPPAPHNALPPASVLDLRDREVHHKDGNPRNNTPSNLELRPKPLTMEDVRPAIAPGSRLKKR